MSAFGTSCGKVGSRRAPTIMRYIPQSSSQGFGIDWSQMISKSTNKYKFINIKKAYNGAQDHYCNSRASVMLEIKSFLKILI